MPLIFSSWVVELLWGCGWGQLVAEFGGETFDSINNDGTRHKTCSTVHDHTFRCPSTVLSALAYYACSQKLLQVQQELFLFFPDKLVLGQPRGFCGVCCPVGAGAAGQAVRPGALSDSQREQRGPRRPHWHTLS